MDASSVAALLNMPRGENNGEIGDPGAALATVGKH
jgi:hypothetical protein